MTGTAGDPGRALKTRGNTPKYGLIFHSSFIGRAKQRNKGRISRYLANKCSIASRCARVLPCPVLLLLVCKEIALDPIPCCCFKPCPFSIYSSPARGICVGV